MIRFTLVFSIVVMMSTSAAELLSFPSFRIEVENGWVHKIESGAETGSGLGSQISIYAPDGSGTLKIHAMQMPTEVSAEVLRNMTNVDSAIQLTRESWGDYSGYQYDYSERDSFFRQWWLALGTEMILVVYDSTVRPADIDIELVDRMVSSITKSGGPVTIPDR